MGASWRTFTSALIVAGGVILTQIGYGLDSDPDTVTNWDLIVKTIGTLLTVGGITSVGWFARDDKVTSEQAGAKP
jgi:hypothetical protein